MRHLAILAFLASARATEVTLPIVQPPPVNIAIPDLVLGTSPPPPQFKPLPKAAPILPHLGFGYVSVDGLIDLYGGTDNLREAMSANRIELVVLQKDAAGLGYWEGTSVAIQDTDVVPLRRLLTSDATFDWATDYECAPEYGFRLKLYRAATFVCVDLCFRCRTLRVLRDGRQTAEKNFDLGYDGIYGIISRYVPAPEQAEANQALQPTPMLVTPRADARVAPSTGAADL